MVYTGICTCRVYTANTGLIHRANPLCIGLCTAGRANTRISYMGPYGPGPDMHYSATPCNIGEIPYVQPMYGPYAYIGPAAQAPRVIHRCSFYMYVYSLTVRRVHTAVHRIRLSCTNCMASRYQHHPPRYTIL